MSGVPAGEPQTCCGWCAGRTDAVCVHAGEPLHLAAAALQQALMCRVRMQVSLRDVLRLLCREGGGGGLSRCMRAQVTLGDMLRLLCSQH